MGQRTDPRLYQIASLAALLVYGIGSRGFDVTPARATLLLASCLAVQWLCERLFGLARFEPKSALISGLSLCLLLRTSSWRLALMTAALAIASKFVLRVRGKHLFNPTNIGLVAMMAATGQVWASPGQWGSGAQLAFLIACAGGLVVNRAARSDVSLAFLLSWSALLLGRAAWLGDPWLIPLHQLGSGALLLFSFFMISDPKTTPDSRAGRLLFALLVAAGAYYVQFKLFRPNALLWSLAATSLVVPLLDRLLPGPRYDWSRPRSEEGRSHAPSQAARPDPVPALAAPA
jgi:Na+-transporting NADH:ubiquinone oxidoreductase subunit NqrB